MENINSIIQFLDDNNIKYVLSYDKTSLYCFEYPQDLRIFYSDVEYEHKNGDIKTVYNGNFIYRIIWRVWNSAEFPYSDVGPCTREAKTQDEVIEIIKQVKKEFKHRHEQLKLFR